MFIFNGHFTWFQYAQNESITIAVPGALEAGQPIWGFWQWTVDGKSVPKANSVQQGTINSVGSPSSDGGRTIDFSFEYYSFGGTVGANNSSLELLMRIPKDEHDPSGAFTLALHYSDERSEDVARAYVGKLEWFHYVQNEMVTLILPVGFGAGAPVCLFFEWTEGKGNWAAATVLREYSVEVDGSVKGTFRGYKETGEPSWYTFNFEVDAGRKVLSLGMKNEPGASDAKSPYKLELVAGPKV